MTLSSSASALTKDARMSASVSARIRPVYEPLSRLRPHIAITSPLQRPG